jgi:hypothetical protein
MMLVLAVGLTLGCGVSRPWALTPRPASAVPERFVPVEARPAGAAGCPVHLKDPRDDTRLELIRSTEVTGQDRGPSHLGDYAVTPAGHYGVKPAELLRLDCETGGAIGVVDRAG